MKKKKVLLFGGGSGLSRLLIGLKEFPIDLTAVITVSDSGASTGKLRQEFQMPAVGDIRKVVSNLSTLDKGIIDLMEFRFKTHSDLNNHPLGNLFLTACYKTSETLDEAIGKYERIMQVKHNVLPVSEDYLTLIAETEDGKLVEGEAQIDILDEKIKRVFYDKEPKVNPKVLKAIREADLIVFSMGSLFTSLLPNLIIDEVREELKKKQVPTLYVSNAVNEPTEGFNFKLSDYVSAIHNALGYNKIDLVIVPYNKMIDADLLEKYRVDESKQLIEVDQQELEKMDVKIIEKHILTTEDGTIKHDSIKTGLCIFNYLMGELVLEY